MHHPKSATAEIVRLVALAHLLPDLKARARAAAQQLDSVLVTSEDRTVHPNKRVLAQMLADADTLARLASTGALRSAQVEAARRARSAIDALPAGLLSADMASRAVSAAGSAARLRLLADALSGAEHAASVEVHASSMKSAAGTSPWEHFASESLDSDFASRARSGAIARAAVTELETIEGEIATQGPWMDGELRRSFGSLSRSGIGQFRNRRRLILAHHRRLRQARVLSELLLAVVETAPPWTEPKHHLIDPGLVRWLRRVTKAKLYTRHFEAEQAQWLGPDPYGLRRLPPPPDFLTNIDVRSLPPEHVAPFLRRISMVGDEPEAQELAAEELAREVAGTSTAVRALEQRCWGQPPGLDTPLLPERTCLPHVVHGVWLGSPPPETSVFWDNFAHGAQRYAGLVDFVLWTDLPRATIMAARTAPTSGRDNQIAKVRKLVDWARANRIHVVNIHEVFHAQAPMKLHVPFVLEMSKQLPRGYASASDHLRVDLIDRFGGAYVDGDNAFTGDESLPDLFDRVTCSLHGFTMNPVPGIGVANDIIIAPARHPALALWSECARLNYSRTQREIFGGLEEMSKRYVLHERQAHRYVAPSRSGRIHHRVLALLGIDSADLLLTKSAIADGSELSWVPPASGQALIPAPRTQDDSILTLTRCITFLLWQLIAREGNLYLSAVADVIRSLPDPDAAWTAVLTALSIMSRSATDIPSVTSVTDARRNDDGTIDPVDLPPEAELLLSRDATHESWLGSPLSRGGEPVWLLDERTSCAALRDATGPPPDYLDVLVPLTEVALDAFGNPLGLWIRPGSSADAWRFDSRFASVPPGHFGISLGGPPGLNWAWKFSIRPEGVARLLTELGATDRPVAITAPMSDSAHAQSLAARLETALRQPVVLAQATDTQCTPSELQKRLLPPVTFVPYSSLRPRATQPASPSNSS